MHTWPAILAALRNATTSATFDHLFAQAELLNVEENGTYHITVPPHALEWVENRLKSLLTNVITQVTGRRPTAIIVTSLSSSPPASAPAPRLDHHHATTLDFEHIWYQTGGTGYDRVPKYALQFWQPYLKNLNRVAWALWLCLQSDDLRPLNADDFSLWTPLRPYHLRELARSLRCSPNTISGSLTPCHVLKRLTQNDPDTDHSDFCCQKYFPTMPATSRNGHPQCLHWVPGALEHLYHEHILLCQKSGDTPRSTIHYIQVFRLLPLLTPTQVDQLDPITQAEHKQWLIHNTGKTGLSLEQWSHITAPSLLPLLPGHQETKALLDPYHPNPLR